MKFCLALDDAHSQVGRPVEVVSGQIETLRNQCYTMWEIVNIFKIFKSIKVLVKVKNMSFILWKRLNGLFGQPSNKEQRNIQKVRV